MIRVGFIINATGSWMGGLNYFKNLLYAISVLEDRKIEPVVFMPRNSDPAHKAMFSQYATVIETSIFDRGSLHFVLWRIFYKFFGSQLILEQLFKKHNIDILSHLYQQKIRRFKTIEWIPDFQHVHLPHMFSQEELHERNITFAAFARQSDIVVVSSHDALNDFCSLYPDYGYKARVLQFVSQPPAQYFELNESDKKYLKSHYGIRQPYFYLPNQFWKHKNHIVAFEAINILKQQGIEITLVCTGHLQDYRNKEHIDILTDYIKHNGLENNILILGLVPYKDVFTLMRFSEMVINPSLFEGWSSTVEECKSVGKRMVLSDLNVHKEQFSEAIFFQKNNSLDLAEKLKEIISHSKDEGITFAYNLEDKTRVYAETYQNIVLECLAVKHD